MSYETKQEQIDEIMDYFDFDKMLLMMQAVDWSWNGFAEITAPDIRAKARKRLSNAWNDIEGEYWSTSSGGIKAVCHQDNEGKSLELIFDAVSWKACEPCARAIKEAGIEEIRIREL